MFLFKFLQRSFSKSPLRTGGGGIDAVMPFIYISDTSSVFTICELLRRSAWCGRGKNGGDLMHWQVCLYLLISAIIRHVYVCVAPPQSSTSVISLK